jgi:predicted YcjX-like family ATPase
MSMDPLAVVRSYWPGRQAIRVGVTGLARSGKTALLTSLAANLLALAAGVPTLPAVQAKLGRRELRVVLSAAAAEGLPRFDHAAHLAALTADPPRWPARTDAVSLLALDLDIFRAGAAALLPPQRVRLEFLDYPGEWLLDLPLLGQNFAAWSEAMLRRLESLPQARNFLAFAGALPKAAGADEALAREGHALYRTALHRLRDENGLSLLQPGRFLMPAPGPPPPWTEFFPLRGGSALAGLLSRRYDAYRDAVRRELLAPGFGRVDRLVVLADVLSALHAGKTAFEDVAAALAAVATALRRRHPLAFLSFLAPFWPELGGISRIAYCASKADHVAARQRGNLAALVGDMVGSETAAHGGEAFAIAAVRCTEDVVWTLDNRPVSAVRGRVAGEGRGGKSYPGEVPDRIPDASFWDHPFLALPDFEPMRVPLGGRGGIVHVDLDRLLVFLLGDLL